MQSMRIGAAVARNLLAYFPYALRGDAGKSSGYVEAGDIRVYYRSYGSGQAVLLLHGGFMIAETWAGQIPALARHYRVIAPDSRGHGRTTLGTLPLTYRQMAADAVALMEGLEVSSAHVVGWSDGGCTALALALLHPEKVKSVALLGTSFHTDNYSPETKEKIEKTLRPRSLSMLGLRALRRMLTPEPGKGEEFLKRMSAMWRELPDFSVEELGRIEAPVLVIGCDRDEFLSLHPDPLRVFKETAAAVPGARLEVIRGGTHFVHMERSRAVNRLILGFIQDEESRGR